MLFMVNAPQRKSLNAFLRILQRFQFLLEATLLEAHSQRAFNSNNEYWLEGKFNTGELQENLMHNNKLWSEIFTGVEK